MKKQNRKMTRIACMLLLLAGVTLCGQEKNPAKKAPAMPAMPSPTVGVAKVFTAEDVLVRNYVGQTVSVAVVNVVPRVSGEIMKVGFADGAQVKEGQVLYKRSKRRSVPFPVVYGLLPASQTLCDLP